MTSPRALTILQHARRILESPDRWEPGRVVVNAAGESVHERPLAANAAGEPVHESSPDAVRWSLQGALHRATHWKHPITQSPTPLPAEAYADEGHIRYVETIECWRRVWGTTGGSVQIAGESHTGEGYDEGTDPRFECTAPDANGNGCGHRWHVPEWMHQRIDWE